MRFVTVKSESQQALLMLHRIRDRLIAERTGTINAIRGHMAEFGIVAARQGPGMKELLAIISDVDDERLPAMARELLVLQVEHFRAIETRIADLDQRLQLQARNTAAATRLTAIPGIGPVIATAMVATVVNAQIFPNGRSFAAWLGLTPRQYSTGGRERLLGISKRGDGYLRRQLMHGARSLVRVAAGRDGRLWKWIDAHERESRCRHPVCRRARFCLAVALPWSAAILYQRAASASSFGTPWPFSYITPRLFCATAKPPPRRSWR